MSIVEFFLVLVLVAILGVIVLAANYADRKRSSGMAWAVIGVVVLINILLVLNSLATVLSSSGTLSGDSEAVDETAAWGGLVASLVVAGLAAALLLRPVRERVAVLFPTARGDKTKRLAPPDDSSSADADSRPQGSGDPLFPQMLNYYTTDTPRPETDEATAAEPDSDTLGAYRLRGFNPASYVHMLAVILAVYLLGMQFINFIVGGGLEGLAEIYEEGGIDVWTLLSNSIPMIVLPFLGVGLGIRRDWRQSLDRLGLGSLTREGLAVSLGITFALFMGLIVIGLIWMTVVPEDVYEEQTQASEALSRSVGTIGIAFMIAATAAVGEEIAFRGALQPVIGFWPTAVVFALTHTQYALTPAWLIIFGVAIAFGWVRQRYNTTVAILTHFWYNLFQLLLLFVGPEETTESVLRILGILV